MTLLKLVVDFRGSWISPTGQGLTEEEKSLGRGKKAVRVTVKKRNQVKPYKGTSIRARLDGKALTKEQGAAYGEDVVVFEDAPIDTSKTLLLHTHSDVIKEFKHSTIKGVFARLLGVTQRLDELPEGTTKKVLEVLSRNMTSSVEVKKSRWSTMFLHKNELVDDPSSHAQPPSSDPNPLFRDPKFLSPVTATDTELYEWVVNGVLPPPCRLKTYSRTNLVPIFKEQKASKLSKIYSEEQLKRISRATSDAPSMNRRGTKSTLAENASAGTRENLLCYALYKMKHLEYRDFVEELGFEWFKGISVNGATLKDIQKVLCGKPPYVRGYPQNIMVVDGLLTIHIQLSSEEQAEKIRNRILSANVGPIFVGKKGLAFLKEISIISKEQQQ